MELTKLKCKICGLFKYPHEYAVDPSGKLRADCMRCQFDIMEQQEAEEKRTARIARKKKKIELTEEEMAEEKQSLRDGVNIRLKNAPAAIKAEIKAKLRAAKEAEKTRKRIQSLREKYYKNYQEYIPLKARTNNDNANKVLNRLALGKAGCKGCKCMLDIDLFPVYPDGIPYHLCRSCLGFDEHGREVLTAYENPKIS